MFLFQVERLRKIEMASDMDEILKEEIREYKETLTCPSCKVKRKDAVLTKCFHCFCYDCLRTRFVDLLAEMCAEDHAVSNMIDVVPVAFSAPDVTMIDMVWAKEATIC